MRLRFKRGPYQHVLARSANVNGGAEELAYEKFAADPILSIQGAGTLCGQMRPVTPAIAILHPARAVMGSPRHTSAPDVYIASLPATIEPPQ